MRGRDWGPALGVHGRWGAHGPCWACQATSSPCVELEAQCLGSVAAVGLGAQRWWPEVIQPCISSLPILGRQPGAPGLESPTHPKNFKAE